MKLWVTALMWTMAAAASDEITSLPGLNASLCFKHFGGYVPVGGGKKNLFYWYTEATSNPEKAPTIFWMNGGPGCSSLAGMFSELGPFVVDEKQQLSLNPYAWNRIANIIYMEQPAGVGFSYPAMATNDSIAASDAYDGIQQFFLLHPEAQPRTFYIAGESYGGHYVPNLVNEIQKRNAMLSPDSNQIINLEGFAVGNAYTDWEQDFNSNVPYSRYHGLTSPENYELAKDKCKGNYAPCFWPRPGYPCSDDCNNAVGNATQFALDGSIDVYDIYLDVCKDGKTRQLSQAFVLEQERRKQINRHRQEGRLGVTPISPIFPTCIDNYVATYLNTPAVQTAIHAKAGTLWAECGLSGLYDFNYNSVVPLYQKWTNEKKLKILVYNGDADFIVNFLGSENWLGAMNLKQLQAWSKWSGSDTQVAGYFVRYDGMAFATVKGAGHMVPKDRPQHALDLITAYIKETPLDKIAPATFGPLCG
jgi:carboxypeptidase C (cathepsin A)